MFWYLDNDTNGKAMIVLLDNNSNPAQVLRPKDTDITVLVDGLVIRSDEGNLNLPFNALSYNNNSPKPYYLLSREGYITSHQYKVLNLLYDVLSLCIYNRVNYPKLAININTIYNSYKKCFYTVDYNTVIGIIKNFGGLDYVVK